MGRAIEIDAGARNRSARVNGVVVPRDEYDELRVMPGDQFTITSTWVPAVVTEIRPGDEILADVAGEPPDDAVVVADDVVAWDLGNTVNGNPWLWWVSLTGQREPFLTPADLAWACTIRIDVDWGGAWKFVLNYGSGYARITEWADGAEPETEVLGQATSISDAVMRLAERVNTQGALSSDDGRRFSMCATCAEEGIDSPYLGDEEECWEFDLSVDGRVGEAAQAALLGALFRPCRQHTEGALTFFSHHWTWNGRAWVVASRS